MKIAFLGNFTVDYSSESHYKKTFEKLGIEVLPIQENKTNAKEVIRTVFASDLFFWVHTHQYHIKGMDEAMKIIKSKGIPTVAYHLDLFKGIGREPKGNDAYWKVDYFFTCDKNFIPDLEELGIKAFYLPAGVYEDECYLEDYNENLAYDVVFTGSGIYHKEWGYRANLIAWLRGIYGKRFGHFGSGGLPVVRGKQLNQLYRSSKVVIGDTFCKGFDYPYYFSDRLFEVIGRGGFLIFPYIKGVEDCFSEDELVTYKLGDFEDLKRKIDFYIESNGSREEIRKRGFERVLKEHTYTNRLKFILDNVKN